MRGVAEDVLALIGLAMVVTGAVWEPAVAAIVVGITVCRISWAIARGRNDAAIEDP